MAVRPANAVAAPGLPVGIAAATVALLTFALYYATLVPGLDFGDAASFEATVGAPIITARKAYPLYFALGDLWIRLTGLEPARALNLASAIAAALACGVLTLVAADLSASVLAGAAAALLFGVSYTFWSQSITAEVYGLHMLFIAATLWLLLHWQRRPTTGRLTAFFAVFALGFGNHLSMILLLPAYALFLLLASPRGWRSLVDPRVVAIATVCAAAGALQYASQFRALWLSGEPPQSLAQGFAMFWFDVTKTDWRDTLVGTLPQTMLADHAAMYWFDLRQQFGAVVPALACAGLLHLAMADVRRAALLALLYVVNVVFAFSYNVGDSHVFFLPSHLVVALLAAPGVMVVGRRVQKDPAYARGAAALPARIAAAVLLVYAGVRAYRDFPALDRRRDTRAAAVIEALTRGLDDRHAILLADMNWQIQNGLAYYARSIRPEIAYEAPDVVLSGAPALVADNRAIAREVVVTGKAAALLTGRYGGTLTATPDARVAAEPLAQQVAGLAPGTRYVLCVLRPTRDLSLDAADVIEAVGSLTGRSTPMPSGDYVAIGGVVGEPPLVVESSERPFDRRVSIAGTPVEIRMESWLASDTIRRMGFGHVIAARVHTLIVERGVSFVAFDDTGQPIRTAYASNIFAPQPRYLIGIATP